MSKEFVSSFAERLKQALENNPSYTATSLADEIGLSKQAISMYLSGDRKPKRPTIRVISETLNVDKAWLMGYDVPMERKEDEKINHLPPNIYPAGKKKYRYLGKVACGEPIFADEQIDTYVDLESDVNADFVLEAKGDSMINARIYNGDLVFIKEQPDVHDGELAVVVIDDEATLKRVYKYDDHLSLVSENPKYKPIIIKATEGKTIRIIGKVIGAYIHLTGI